MSSKYKLQIIYSIDFSAVGDTNQEISEASLYVG